MTILYKIVSQTASFEISLVRPSVCPSVGLSVCLPVYPSIHLSLSFLKNKPLVFPDIVHDDSWSWYLVIDGASIWKKNGDLNFGLNQAKNEVFCYLIEFESYIFLEIAYNDSSWQCLMSSRDKTHENVLGYQIQVLKYDFHYFFQVWLNSFSLSCIGW